MDAGQITVLAAIGGLFFTAATFALSSWTQSRSLFANETKALLSLKDERIADLEDHLARCRMRLIGAAGGSEDAPPEPFMRKG